MARVGEIGLIFRMGLSFDVSGFTSFSLVLTKPDNTTITRTNPDVSVETSQVTTSLGTFAANESIKYTIQSGDLDQAGGWSAQLTYVDATKTLISDPGSFTISS